MKALSPLDRLATWLATVFGIGLAPKAPGTFGSLPGLLVGAGVHVAAYRLCSDALPWARSFVILLLLALATALALWAIARAETALATHDDQRIVIDEVVGQAIAVAFVPVAIWPYLLGFLLFRLFDITKPWLIGRVDKEVPGAVGTLGDDVLAGVIAGLILVAVTTLVGF